jgi:hypothetical protein
MKSSRSSDDTPDAVTPRKPGRPRIELDARSYRSAELLAGYGLTTPQIAHVLRMSTSTLFARIADDDDLAVALVRGRAVAQAKVARALFDLATGCWTTQRRGTSKNGKALTRTHRRLPDVNAIRWFEMTRLGYGERVQHADVPVEDTTEAAMDDRVSAILNIIDLARERARRSPR